MFKTKWRVSLAQICFGRRANVHIPSSGFLILFCIRDHKHNDEIVRGGASLETPGSERGSEYLWELACEDDIYSASPARIRAFFIIKYLVLL